ncbi:C2H2-type_zinc finger domain-containing protein [Hexamita inflata]|uniref:C2H2-type zinc finger domain-containing protein n=1 Tax=Hexamita inflata TaxID=28002 RepID=A0AA86P8J7_9EUKA|nr:C2H2-type zinc finger domain-containing protein [Hexamita inflata]
MSIYETSESASTMIQKPVDLTDIKFVKVFKPVPCTTCHVPFKTREEQIIHYHDEAHIERLRMKCSAKTGEIWAKVKTNEDLDVEIININLDENNNELSNISHYSQIEFHCGCCNQRFKSEAALDAHLGTKKHKRNAEQEHALVVQTGAEILEVIE